MLIYIDQRKCQTIGICVRECPEIFRFQTGSKKAMITTKIIPEKYMKKCREIATKCPTGAIIIRDEI